MKAWVRAFVLSRWHAVGYAALAQQVAPARQEPARPVSAAPCGGSSGDARKRRHLDRALGRLHHGMQAFVESPRGGGIVTLVARDGKVVDVHATGFQDVESKTPMRENTIFRIASMTKPITSVAVMMLYEEGKLLLTDPVSKFIPAFKGSSVHRRRGRRDRAGAARASRFAIS